MADVSIWQSMIWREIKTRTMDFQEMKQRLSRVKEHRGFYASGVHKSCLLRTLPVGSAGSVHAEQ